jgi:hypothetical protein
MDKRAGVDPGPFPITKRQRPLLTPALEKITYILELLKIPP